jgi:hypothetical protein
MSKTKKLVDEAMAKKYKTAAWQRAAGQDPEGGLNERGRASLRAQGQDIKRPVKKDEAERSDVAAGRRKSFCARMQGMKEKLTSSKTANDPNSRINKSLRAWDCN